ncbi:MAG: DUF493 domain-containing protein [Pseudomonadota bacterium]|nr:DUF493 domain-containing protein [Pseudomonadota bacterium]
MERLTATELLDAHHTFPSDHAFRAIVRADPAEVDAVLVSVAAFCGLTDLEDRVVRVPSSAGKWLSLRMALPCDSATRVLEIYAHLQALPQVVRCL